MSIFAGDGIVSAIAGRRGPVTLVKRALPSNAALEFSRHFAARRDVALTAGEKPGGYHGEQNEGRFHAGVL